MKRVFVFIFLAMSFLYPQYLSAQLIDDLFEEEDFNSSEIKKMQENEEARKKAEASNKKETARKPSVASQSGKTSVSENVATVQGNVKTPSSVVSVPSAVNASENQSATQENEKQNVPAARTKTFPKSTFSLSAQKPQKIETVALPSIGSGKVPDLPDLGSKAFKEDENLSLFEMRAKRTGSSNTNVLNFDIAGIKLKMTPEEVMEKAQAAGFTLKWKNFAIPDLNEWKYKRICMDNFLFTYENKKRCVREIAQYNNSEYISRLVFENKKRRETLSIDFSSFFSNNEAYYIRYVSKGDHSLGTTDEAHYLKTRRRQEFLRLLITKYGAPDDEQALLWGVSGITATLQAELNESFLDATIILEDSSIADTDFEKMSIDDATKPAIEKFSF